MHGETIFQGTYIILHHFIVNVHHFIVNICKHLLAISSVAKLVTVEVNFRAFIKADFTEHIPTAEWATNSMKIFILKVDSSPCEPIIDILVSFAPSHPVSISILSQVPYLTCASALLAELRSLVLCIFSKA